MRLGLRRPRVALEREVDFPQGMLDVAGHRVLMGCPGVREDVGQQVSGGTQQVVGELLVLAVSGVPLGVEAQRAAGGADGLEGPDAMPVIVVITGFEIDVGCRSVAVSPAMVMSSAAVSADERGLVARATALEAATSVAASTTANE